MDRVSINSVRIYENSLYTFLKRSPLFKPYKYSVVTGADKRILSLC